MRLLYAHGLESGPSGRKVTHLRDAGFDVRCVQMPCGAEAARIDPTRMYRESLAVQREALAAGPIDVLMGSSFGGAIALALLHEGLWAGPTVLLCPAEQVLAERMGARPLPGLRALPDRGARVLVVHGRNDDVVPHAHSRALVAGSAAQLLELDDDHPLTRHATPAGLSAWARLVAPRDRVTSQT